MRIGLVGGHLGGFPRHRLGELYIGDGAAEGGLRPSILGAEEAIHGEMPTDVVLASTVGRLGQVMNVC